MRLQTLRVAFLAAAVATTTLTGQPRTIGDFFEAFTSEWIRGNPNLAASTRFFTGEEQRQFERQLTPLTREWRNTRLALAQRALADLRAFDRSRMTDADRVSAELLAWQLDTEIRADRYRDYYFPFEQFNGVNVGIVALLTVSHPLVTESDAENYVARLGEVAPRLREAVAESRRLIAAGMIPPRFIVRATLTQMQQFVAVAAGDNPFVTAFADRMTSAAAIPEARRQPLRAQAEAIVASQIYPAWNEAIAVMDPLIDRATDAAGLWRFAGGGEAYADALRRFTTTNLTADQIHDIGLREVARLEGEMDGIFKKLGRTQGSIQERIAQLKKDQAYPLTEAGRDQILADTERIMRDADTRAAEQFDRRPKSPVVVRPFPRFREANAAASYTAPAPDGSRPGTFQIPLRAERMTKFGLRTLVYHETVPGHHFQVALEMENDAAPRFRRLRVLGSISALSEGWGLYAERLAAESGWYEGDLEGLLGQLDGSLFRARRLVVDTGLHARRWTREQAIAYGIEASEIERYVVNPGQACAYMIGQLKIVELRTKARNALGARFSERAFHNTVLGTGTVPLETLERQVDAYIRNAS